MDATSQRALRFADGRIWELGRRTRVMGVVNVTPDSFSDGGTHARPRDAVEMARRMAGEGADIIDVGGESSRPGARPVPLDEELRRVLPVVEGIKASLAVRVSVDTTKAEVAARAVDAGADVINDVSALSDPGMLDVVRGCGVPVVLMHMRGTPATMQADTRYRDVVGEVAGFLRESAEKAVGGGVRDDKIIVDPGIGFGKSPIGNLRILGNLAALVDLGHPVLVGASRKSFIGAVLELPVGDRLEGGLAIAALAAWQGVHAVRVHDVEPTVRAVRMIDAIRNA